MSERWPGGIVRATPVTPTGPYQNGTAPGVWTLEQANYWVKQGLWPIAGNEQLVVEDVFSTYVYAGNNTSQTITNGINLSGQGGMVWTKDRTSAYNNVIVDSTRSLSQGLITNNTNPNTGITGDVTSFNSNGYSLGNVTGWFNNSGDNYVSWTFRKAPKFFDVVTYTGNGVNGRQIAHNLGVTPGFIIYKCTSTATSWLVLHRSLPNGFSDAINLNTTDAAFSLGASFAPTATTFTMSNGVDWNQNGQTYVAYLYAHDASSDGIIQCGSFDVDGSGNATVNLGWEPQWVLMKTYEAAANWGIYDNMRGMPVGNTNVARLFADTSSAEGNSTDYNVSPTATGFTAKATGYTGSSVNGFIYVAIRRGPMRTPTLGTAVFSPIARTGTGTTFVDTTNFPVDSIWFDARSQARGALFIDRLRGFTKFITPNNTNAENTNTGYVTAMGNTGFTSGTDLYFNDTGQTYVDWCFRRAPSFFDEVCYTGTGVARTVNHNLGVVPEMIIVKSRTQAGTYWMVQHSALGPTKDIYLQLTNAASTRTAPWNNTAPTSTVFTVGTDSDTNGSGQNLVAYLFASCPGVSKVGSYTGTGALQTINCGFTTGARFVLIKRTDSTGDWFVWDSARGISSGNDPYLLLNSTAAEVTGTNYVDTTSVGFQVTAAAPAGINANGGSYIFLAVA